MDAFEKPPPYAPSASTVVYPPGYQAATAPCNQYYVPPVTTQPAIPAYGTITVPVNTTIIVGGCPVCKMGILRDFYPCSALCLALCCCPIGGICCCLAMKQQRCSNCGTTFSS